MLVSDAKIFIDYIAIFIPRTPIVHCTLNFTVHLVVGQQGLQVKGFHVPGLSLEEGGDLLAGLAILAHVQQALCPAGTPQY